MFELLLQDLVNKAGFETDKGKLRGLGFLQIHKALRRIHGRGSTYHADVVGLFKLPVPFTYPLFLVGEAKYKDSVVDIKEAREFLGAYTDFSQYPRINTRGKTWKRDQIFSEQRVSYVPAYFSAGGFGDAPQALMYAHGIYFVSYENSPMFISLKARLEKLIRKIDASRITKEEMSRLYKFESLNDLTKWGSESKKKGFDIALNELRKLLSKTTSYVGMLDDSVVVHVLSRRKAIKVTKNTRECYAELQKDNFIKIRTTPNPKSGILGGFSMPLLFLSKYLRSTIKRQKPFLNSLVIYTQYQGRIFPVYIKFSEESINKIKEYVLSQRNTKNRTTLVGI